MAFLNYVGLFMSLQILQVLNVFLYCVNPIMIHRKSNVLKALSHWEQGNSFSELCGSIHVASYECLSLLCESCNDTSNIQIFELFVTLGALELLF